MQLTGSTLERTRAALQGPHADAVVNLLFDLLMRRRDSGANGEAAALLQDLGFITRDPIRLTRLGYLAADSIREYVFWLGRDRRLPCEGRVTHLSAAHYRGKKILEVGCGMGCNLMSIAGEADRVVGLEPVAVYRQMSAILCERSKLEPVEIKPGTGERIPFEDNTFDIVLSVSAHQYMDVRTALAEMTRVLVPGGELQIVGGTLDTFIFEGLKPIAHGSLRGLKDYSVTIANTLTYSAFNRRVVGSSSASSTGYPVYPREKRMAKWLEACGLRMLRPIERVYPESCFSYIKPA